MPTRPALYSSPIQHVLVLQEEDENRVKFLDDSRPWNDRLPRPPTPTPPPTRHDIPYLWRVGDRMRTSHGVLVLCLNVGCDPPATPKPKPCAILEAWIDPKALPPTDSIKAIAHALKAQYERWQPKTRYKVAPDPTVIDLKRVCVNLRRAAKDERVLFHYNGHGVPKPTEQGEIWVFNQNYSHYIPFNLLDLHEVLGSPTLYIFDCNSAGVIFNHFTRVNEQLERRWEEACKRDATHLPPPSHRNSIFLGSCAAGESLPTSSAVPADLFTSCLTTPLKTALHWFLKRTLVRGVTPDMLDRIPGNLNSRHTPLGELNWVFTAITDTIAWNALTREMFKKLYRQDMLVAGLMRNFLLADRIMRSFGCHPISYPVLPETHTHPLWDSFELSMEQLLAQLPTMLAQEEPKLRRQEDPAKIHGNQVRSFHTVRGEDREQVVRSYGSRSQTSQPEAHSKPRYKYRSCTFFEDQMRAFNVWLDIGPEQRNGPEQLPIMLQVLLSPTLRIQALPMISRYLQTGPAAVDQALAVGIFPYVLRLLQSQSADMRQDLIFIWSKILAFDDSCRSDLVKDKGEEYFVRFLMPGRGEERDSKPVYLAVAMFVLSVLAKDYADRCRAVGTLEACYTRLSHESPFVRRWACLCLTEVIQRASVPSQSQAIAWIDLVQTLRCRATKDEAPDVRAAAVSTLSAIMNGVLKTLPDESNGPNSVNVRQEFQGLHNASHTESKFETDNASAFSRGSNDLASGTLDANGKLGFEDVFMTGESEIIDAPVHPLSPDEREAVLSIGNVIAEVGRWESSVLVRREVAIAIAKAVTHCQHRFVRAAYVVDVMGIDEEDDLITSSDLAKCESVYQRLWSTLSDLAYDPHPIIAALARRSYDIILGKLGDTSRPESPFVAGDDSLKASPLARGGQDAIASSSEEPAQNGNFTSGYTDTSLRVDGNDFAKLRATVHDKDNLQSAQNANVFPLRARDNKRGSLQRLQHVSAASPPRMGSSNVPKGLSPLVGRSRRGMPPTDPLLAAQADQAAAEIVHVRSDSGSFNLDAPSGIPKVYRRIPRVNSFSFMSLKKNSPDANDLGRSPPQRSRSTIGGSFDLTSLTQKIERSPSIGQSALVARVGALAKTLSQQFNLSALAGPHGRDQVGMVGGEHSESSTDNSLTGISPPHHPKRSQSYQVLNAAAILSPRKDSQMYGMSRHTSYVKPMLPRDKSLALHNRQVASMFDRLFLSSAGDAALSLYEWSSASISKVEATATSDSIQEEESIPRYAALWHKFTTRGGDIPVEDNLRAFARLGESDSLRLGPIVNVNEEGNDFKTARQLSLFAMGAGGGAITSMTFLPRDSGMGDDQLLATGDSTESVGVYDVRTGKRQGAFRVPSPPGIPEVGISSILCLNKATPTTMENDEDQPNSRSALILAGAYDGRVGVFKSDYQGRKYRIMSTFQASGPSFYSKAGTNRDRAWKLRSASLSRNERGSFTGKASPQTMEDCSTGFANAVRDTGNGLALAFDASSSFLAAGGCDSEIVRVWDLRREQCVWEGAAVKKGTVPTALCMWNRVNPNLFVVGSSGGRVNLIDMREPIAHSSDSRDFKRLGSHSEPVISIGTCPRGKNDEGETVVAADIGGQIAFWEPRWNDERSENNAKNDDTTRIKAHSSIVAAMAVHSSGRYVASGSLFGSADRSVKIFGPNRRMVKRITHFKRPGGMLLPYDNRISPVTSLTFEHETSLLAIGCIDSSVMIYGRPEHISSV